MNWREVPVPARMAKLPRDRRGYPIPWVVLRDKEGRAHFTVNDELKRRLALKKELCPICGRKLLRGRWFVGGGMSATHPQGAYLDPPMHDECAHYALLVCPYLAAPSYAKRIDDKTLKRAPPSDGVLITLDPTMLPSRPTVFVAVMAIGSRITGMHPDGSGPFVAPRRPYRKIEYWRHGQNVGAAVGGKAALKDMVSLGLGVQFTDGVRRALVQQGLTEAQANDALASIMHEAGR
jgi:hypothetical protein